MSESVFLIEGEIVQIHKLGFLYLLEVEGQKYFIESKVSYAKGAKIRAFVSTYKIQGIEAALPVEEIKVLSLPS